MWTKKLLDLSGAILAASSIFAASAIFAARSLRAAPEDPWTTKQTVQPADFAKELQQEKDPYPTVIYVGVKTLYEGGHIPGAVFYGPGSTEQGLAELKKFAATLPKKSDVLLYCGCCPLEKCPNLRPAFSTLKDRGFARLRVLLLPMNFNTDWVEKGFPIHKGEKP
jgi:thiosulfate/3-mercaptopyruvate sulfurtransferase